MFFKRRNLRGKKTENTERKRRREDGRRRTWIYESFDNLCVRKTRARTRFTRASVYTYGKQKLVRENVVSGDNFPPSSFSSSSITAKINNGWPMVSSSSYSSSSSSKGIHNIRKIIGDGCARIRKKTRNKWAKGIFFTWNVLCGKVCCYSFGWMFDLCVVMYMWSFPVPTCVEYP